MAKLDKNYIPLSHFLCGLIANMAGIFEITPEEGEKERNRGISNQLTGAFQPVVDMAKDAADTFKPYRSRYYVRRDALQPLYGIGNVFKGLLYLIALIPIAFLGLGLCIFKEATSELPLGGAMLLSWFIDGILSIFRGITQIAFTPLSWIKMITRAIILAFTKEEDIRVENRKGIQKLVEQASTINKEYVDKKEDKQECLNKLFPIASSIHAKYIEGIKRGEDTNIDAKNLGKTYLEKINYLKLFGFAPDTSLEQIDKNLAPTNSVGCNVQ